MSGMAVVACGSACPVPCASGDGSSVGALTEGLEGSSVCGGRPWHCRFLGV